MSKRYAAYVAVVNEEGEAVITRSVGGYNDLYTLPEANRIINRWRELIQDAEWEDPEVKL
jgi:hypothetical protein